MIESADIAFRRGDAAALFARHFSRALSLTPAERSRRAAARPTLRQEDAALMSHATSARVFCRD